MYSQIAEIVGDTLSPVELLSVCLRLRAMLTDDDLHWQAALQALQAGDAERVLAMLRCIVTPPDADAPTAERPPSQ